MTDSHPPVPSPDERAQQAADRLALALEEAGFDVGLEFPSLRIGWDNSGAPGVHLGAVTSAVAVELALLLEDAATVGVKLPAR
jgi:hypothetical protein